MIELANSLDRRLQLLVIVEPAANLANPLVPHAELPGASTGIPHRQNPERAPLAIRALRAAAGMAANGTLQQGSAQDLAGDGEMAEKLLAHPNHPLVCHRQQ